MLEKRPLLAAALAGAAPGLLLCVAVLFFGALNQRRSEGHAPELIDVMPGYQRFMAKSWMAAEAGNWRLAAWYLRKVELSAQRVTGGDVAAYPGYDAAGLTEAMLLPAVMSAQEATDAGDIAVFADAYDAVVGACNACHAQMAHDYVVIIRPTGRDYSNQRFATP
jgi:hypothetical protein